jgi:hypothetical protein
VLPEPRRLQADAVFRLAQTLRGERVVQLRVPVVQHLVELPLLFERKLLELFRRDELREHDRVFVQARDRTTGDRRDHTDAGNKRDDASDGDYDAAARAR